jgi:DMSO/TMAO reductase YedYZ molybdopterin-dependent catalytic subunit
MRFKWLLASVLIVFSALATLLAPAGSYTPVPSQSPAVEDAGPIALSASGSPAWFVVEGLVENRLNLSYAELLTFPLVSEVATLHCVGSGNGTGGSDVNYNWTGVPLFVILEMAKVTVGPYRRVVFNATDGFSDSILLDVAMNPTTILALKANGTDLEQVPGFGGGYRIVLPGRWGYKWVKWIKQIIVVDYLYKGRYEKWGLPDDALRPNCSLPMTTPSVMNYSSNRAQILTDGLVQSFDFNPSEKMTINLTAQGATSAYLYVAFGKGLLADPHNVRANGNSVDFSEVETNSTIYVFLDSVASGSTIEIVGALQGYVGGHARCLLQ